MQPTVIKIVTNNKFNVSALKSFLQVRTTSKQQNLLLDIQKRTL